MYPSIDQKYQTLKVLEKIVYSDTSIKVLDKFNKLLQKTPLRLAFLLPKTNMPVLSVKRTDKVQLGLLYFINLEKRGVVDKHEKLLYSVQFRYPAPNAPTIKYLPTTFIRAIASI